MTYIPQTDTADIDELLATHRAGYALERAFYTDSGIFEAEFKHIISRQWQYVDHLSRISNKGDFVLFRIAGEEIIVVRGEGDEVYAHFNVCRHRGSRICLEDAGSAKRLTCPYHAWSYRLDGSLAHARAMPPEFDVAEFGLRSCAVRVFAGCIFINMMPDGATSFDPIEQALTPWIAQADLRNTKIVFHETYDSQVNWKIALENYFECYHCFTTHPEFCRVQLHTARDGGASTVAIESFNKHNDEWARTAEELGHLHGSFASEPGATPTESYAAQMHYAERMLIHNDPEAAYAKLSEVGELRATKLLGRYAAEDNGQVDWGIMPSFFCYTSCTSTVIYRITPLSPTRCELAQTWLVHKDAIEGVDYDVHNLTWVDRATQNQDEAIVRDTQAGVTSRFYEPGPYAILEEPIMKVYENYIHTMRRGRELEAVG